MKFHEQFFSQHSVVRLRKTKHMGTPLRGFMFALALTLMAGIQPAVAVDPQYQPEMRRLVQLMGSLYFLQPLCGFNRQDWRLHAAELIDLDQPADDRRQRLVGAFNEGYEAYARVYLECTVSAAQAQERLLREAGDLSGEIHSRYAE